MQQSRDKEMPPAARLAADKLGATLGDGCYAPILPQKGCSVNTPKTINNLLTDLAQQARHKERLCERRWLMLTDAGNTSDPAARTMRRLMLKHQVIRETMRCAILARLEMEQQR